ncbi:MAG: T9SS type A sorting domain-containing protein [Candidatus Krumholzibacteria bacterium]
MKCILRVVTLCVGVCCLVSTALAQTPTITVYFDTGRATDCPGTGVVGTVTIVAEGFNALITGAEYKVDYPPSMVWIADLETPPVTFGTSPSGISMGFPLPRDGFQPVVLQKAIFQWNCTDCSDATNDKLCVVPHPLFASIRATRWPTNTFIDATGRCSVVCPQADLDVRPASCPNPFNAQLFNIPDGSMTRKGGILPVAVLGFASFDVADIDMGSMRLEGVAPLADKTIFEDVATSVDPEGGCFPGGPDGFVDVQMKFSSQAIAAAIGSAAVGEDVTVTLTGTFLDGVPFATTDVLNVVSKGTPPPVPINLTTSLLPATPNPFNPVTRLGFSIASAQRVHLAVYDVTGRLVDVIVDGVRQAGEHTVTWDAAGLASGVYFYRLKTREQTLTRRMVLLK